MSKKASRIIILLSLTMFLATTISLIVLLLVYEEKTEYAGEIIIENQEQYHNFLDAIFTKGVDVNALYGQRGNITSLSTHREALWIDFPYPMPAPMGFNLSSMQNPLANLPNTSTYKDFAAYGNISWKWGKIIYSLSIAMTGYSLTIGLWISRHGIHEKPKLVKIQEKIPHSYKKLPNSRK